MSAALTFPVPVVEPEALTPLTPVLSYPDNSGAAASASAGEWSVPRLTAAVRLGDEGAVRDLHARYCERLMRYALVITRGDEATAADAVQAAFLKAVRSLRQLPDESALWAWLARVARTSAADAGRRSRRYSAVLFKVAALFTRDTAPAEDTEAIWHEALETALAELDSDARGLIAARYYTRTLLADIAITESTTERAIEGRLARIREKLRRSILQQLAARHHED